MGVPGRKFEIIHEVISQNNNKLTITELCNIAGVSYPMTARIKLCK